ncbi:putative SOS response-associated peptidase YedK [Arthrobacter sp. CAN_A214]
MTDKDQIQHFLTAVPESVLIPRIVGKDVGSVRNDGPQLIQPVG